MEFFLKYRGWFVILMVSNACLGWIAVRNEERPRILTHPLNWALMALGIILWLMQTWGVTWTPAGFGSVIVTWLGTFFVIAWGKYGACLTIRGFARRRASRRRKAATTVATPSPKGVDYSNQEWSEYAQFHQ